MCVKCVLLRTMKNHTQEHERKTKCSAPEKEKIRLRIFEFLGCIC